MRKGLAAFFISALCVAIFIIVFGQTFASVQLHEVGDFAANSLLIADAKHLKLLVGHYSRLGFNHPGPAFLYVLAAGEIVFSDLMHWVASPFSGQIYAVALLSGFWIAAIGMLLIRMQRATRGVTAAAVVTTALFVGVTAYINYQAFAGPWFPHLYYFAFAAFTVSVGALIMGRADGLVLLAVSLGFLLNGHASFLGMTVVMLACALIANTWLSFRPGANETWVLSRQYLAGNVRTIAVALAIVVLFVVPLAIQTILHFPGPLAEYAAFGRAHHANRLMDAARFAGLFWSNGIFGILLGAAACAVLVTNDPARDNAGRVAPERALSLALASATVAFLFYAVFGVDDLSLTYVGIFYYAVPALALTLLAKRVLDNMTVVTLPVAALVCVAVGAFTAIRIHQPPENLSQYDNPHIPAAYAAIRNLDAGGGVAVFDLDGSADWERLWPILVGIEAYAKRQGSVPFCIAQNWQLVFTRSARCTPDQIRSAHRRFLVSAVPKEGLTGVLNVSGLYFYPRDAAQ
ncbi:hypothetical protein BJG93_09590 [Paraburkholderia sprentiae WSM5005]|uniref:Glycosyltransferase RgtA/B/C/D-like domain-containing protein n=1 Tax=Paraburkholderia sprentiae WSM5005 TaxID=754502 RepID=A0A1I9YH29_9BURK|nr:hypothetical protein [Paraburkholderia sprentiae]APA85612.1 hypothetical protein BJG93_09590 [Paraburkholderia sprentiae WSM5005]